MQVPIVLEPDTAIPKAQRPVFNEGAHVRPDRWPGPGAITTNLDVYPRVLVLLKGEQNKFLPCLGSEQHAAPYTPHIFHFSPLPDTCAQGAAPSEGAASIRCTADPHLEVLKPPNPNEGPLHEAGGACLGSTGPVHTAGKAGSKAIECATVEVHEPGGALLDVNTASAPTEGTASIELAGRTVQATTAKPEALEP